MVRSFIRWLGSMGLISWLVIIAVTAILIALLVPPRPTPRVYFEGKSQYHWMNQLNWDEDPEKRREAAVALGEILRSTKIKCRCLIVANLRLSRSHGKPAIPALIELLDDDDKELRQDALAAIEQIDPAEFARLSAK